MLANTPEPPYYAVIFTSIRTHTNDGYGDMAAEMAALAQQQEGYLGIESARNEIGITVSYWSSLEAISKWKAHSRHLLAQKYGRDKWYEHYTVRICLVEHAYKY